MSASRTHITLPEDVRQELDRLVEPRKRSRFITEAVKQALLIARQKQALRLAAGSWKDEDHPELKAGAEAWTNKLRNAAESRFKKQFRKQ